MELSIDTVNAFNSLSWKTIEMALEHHTFSCYRRKEVGYYQSERSIEFILEGGNIVQRGEWQSDRSCGTSTIITHWRSPYLGAFISFAMLTIFRYTQVGEFGEHNRARTSWNVRCHGRNPRS